MHPPEPPLNLPRRERMRSVYQEARFGGKCPEILEPFQKQNSQNPKAYFQTEDCRLCKEHCAVTEPEKEVYDWPALPYPGEDPSCVGYCPGQSGG